MMQKIDHIGIAVSDLQSTIEKYQLLFGSPPDSIEEISGQGVRVAMFRIGESALEFLQGTTADSPITRYVEKHGEGIHHICLAVQNLERALKEAINVGFEPIARKNDQGAGGSRVAFLHPKSTGGVLIELVEK